MKICDQCKLYDECEAVWKNTENPVCVSFTKIKTNGDRIRAMSDEELAKQIAGEWCDLVCENDGEYCFGNCEEKVLKWLKQEAIDYEKTNY